MGCTNVIHEKEYDFFEMVDKLDYDIIISNPPFTIKKDIMIKLKEIDKPFILIMPCSVLVTKYIRDLYRNDIQIVLPKKRIQFYRLGTDNEPAYNGKSCFECLYYCYKCNLPRQINWLTWILKKFKRNETEWPDFEGKYILKVKIGISENHFLTLRNGNSNNHREYFTFWSFEVDFRETHLYMKIGVYRLVYNKKYAKIDENRQNR